MRGELPVSSLPRLRESGLLSSEGEDRVVGGLLGNVEDGDRKQNTHLWIPVFTIIRRGGRNVFECEQFNGTALDCMG